LSSARACSVRCAIRPQLISRAASVPSEQIWSLGTHHARRARSEHDHVPPVTRRPRRRSCRQRRLPPITSGALQRSFPLDAAGLRRSLHHRVPESLPASSAHHPRTRVFGSVQPRHRRLVLPNVRFAVIRCPTRQPQFPSPTPRWPVSPLPGQLACSCSPLHACCPLAPANHSASGLAINICDVLVEEGGPRVEAKRRGGDPLPRCQVQSQISGASGQPGTRCGASPRERRTAGHPKAASPADMGQQVVAQTVRRRAHRRAAASPRRRGRTRPRL